MTRNAPIPALPIDEVLPHIVDALLTDIVSVLVAPPGAGKTTRIPLALLDQPWAAARKIIVLEPRRVAARAAAERMASMLGETLGQTVGLRARLATRVSAATRIEVVTEGVFTRMALDDPELSGVAAVLFDEFHERSLDADFGLALALDSRENLRPDLRLLIMSATLDGARVAPFIGAPKVITSEGRAYPIETRHVPRSPDRIEKDVAQAILSSLRADTGSILVFLPGQAEINRVRDAIADDAARLGATVMPLHGALTPAEQDRAISPVRDGARKVVLATSIAETSITIDGVRVVIDCGLSRVPRYEPDIGVTRLETVRVARAAADQRRGRAGRTQPGICYRLWHENETQGLVPFAEPEIKNADLSALLLACCEWGTTDPRTLRWLDPPTEGPLKATRETLQAIGALASDGQITAHGRAIRALPLPPRLAHMIIKAAEHGQANDAALIAGLIVERGIGGTDPDLDRRIENARRDASRRTADVIKMSRGWAKSATDLPRRSHQDPPHRDPLSNAALLAFAYPERIAKARGNPGQFLLANGRAGSIDPTHPLAREPWLVVGELQGKAAATRILLAARLDSAELQLIAGDQIITTDDVEFDDVANAVRARRTTRLGAIRFESTPRALQPSDDVAAVLAAAVTRRGVDKLPWSKAQSQLLERIRFLHQRGSDDWPDVTAFALNASTNDWLAPHISGCTKLSDITAEKLDHALAMLVPWDARRRLDEHAPSHFTAPTGNAFAIDYDGPNAPAVHVRVQELFGISQHPSIAAGRLPLTFHLLSPAHREIQITRDLPQFWATSWSAVRADMRGQYPRHEWPQAPANAAPTARAKPRK